MKFFIPSGTSVILSLFFSLALSPGAHADWQAHVKTEVTGKKMAPIDGTMWVSKAGVRIDVTTPADISMIVQIQKKKAFTLMHLAKIVMESDVTQYQDQIPACTSEDPKTCYAKLGLKKTGTETVNGLKCEILEGSVNHSKVKIWHPEGQKEGPPARSIVFLEDGGKVDSQFTNVKTQTIPASTFQVPKNYKAAGAIEDLVKSIQGFSR